MRTFRITLSHGDESITFDGAGARSGSMFHVRRDAIEGLWSSPSSKVSLTERETANGASPISDGETLYAARTAVIPFAIQSNYNHTDLIRARILLGRLIGWHDVRMDIYDDGDETVLYGYIEAKYSDIPYDHADTGTITLVCPDPRRVSKNASTVTMNTSSSSHGGLSFGTPAYALAWTGTANASTSTLSQDGSVVATQYMPNPAWQSSGTPLTSILDGSVSYRWADRNAFSLIPDGVTTYGPYAEQRLAGLPAGSSMVLYMEVGGGDSGTARGNILSVTDSGGNTLTQLPILVPNRINTLTFTVPDNGQIIIKFRGMLEHTVVFYDMLLCTAADWSVMQALGVTWFDGDSQSPQPNTGLAFPLNFGQTGNMGNTGMIVNNGSYVSTPIITAHGGLDSGLTIHWNTSDGSEGDLSYNGSIQNVPVTINTDSHSAIMGGLDVSYQLGSRDWPRIPAGGSCSFTLLASGGGWVSIQSHDTYM